MFKITSEQINSLKASRTDAFCQQIAGYLEELYGDAYDAIGDLPEKREWIAEVVEAAYGYGFDTQSEIYSYVRAAIIFDEDFHQQPWAKEVLGTRAMPATRALLLDDAVTDVLEKELASAEAKRKIQLEAKAVQYAAEKAGYVKSFDVFYGLGLDDSYSAERWLHQVARQAIIYGFHDDFLLDAYLEVAMYYGPMYHELEWASKILTAQSDPATKCKQLLTHLSANYGQPLQS